VETISSGTEKTPINLIVACKNWITTTETTHTNRKSPATTETEMPSAKHNRQRRTANREKKQRKIHIAELVPTTNPEVSIFKSSQFQMGNYGLFVAEVKKAVILKGGNAHKIIMLVCVARAVAAKAGWKIVVDSEDDYIWVMETDITNVKGDIQRYADMMEKSIAEHLASVGVPGDGAPFFYESTPEKDQKLIEYLGAQGQVGIQVE
jgi:hypothetical protein